MSSSRKKKKKLSFKIPLLSLNYKRLYITDIFNECIEAKENIEYVDGGDGRHAMWAGCDGFGYRTGTFCPCL